MDGVCVGWWRKEVKLTLRDRGSAVAEQGQTSLGYIRLCTEGAAAQCCTRVRPVHR